MNQIVKALKAMEAEAGKSGRWNLETLCKMAALEIETKAATIARLTAANESMQEDAVQNTYALSLFKELNDKQAEEINELKTTMGLLIEVAKLVPDLDPDCMAGIVLKEAQEMVKEVV